MCASSFQTILIWYLKESPTISTTTIPENMTVTTFSPQNHQQVPFLPPQLEGLQSQSTITESIFIPGNMEHGFHPMAQMSDQDIYSGDVSNSRYDKGPVYFVDQPRKYKDNHKSLFYPTKTSYKPVSPYRTIPIPLKQPSFTSRPIRGYPYPRNNPYELR